MMHGFFRSFALLFLVLAVVASAALAEPVRLSALNRVGGVVELVADNDLPCPVWLIVDFSTLQRMEADVEIPYSTTLPPLSRSTRLLALKPIGTGAWSYYYSYRWTLGDPVSANHEDGFIYLLPYEHGTKHRVGQAYHGSFTHKGDNAYALDFDMAEGTPVTAARAGIVVDVKEDSSVGGPGVEYENKGNYLRILHDDGSFGSYFHFRLDGVVVETGQAVTAGQLLGYSGSTGRSSGPHLHFDVSVPTEEGKLVTLPTAFMGVDGEPFTPELGRYCWAAHPGGRPFDPVLGSDISESDFLGYGKPLEAGSAVDIRTETLDGTVLIFARNRREYAVTLTLELDLAGMESSGRASLTSLVPARTETFLLLIRARPDAEKWSYAYSFRYAQAPRQQ